MFELKPMDPEIYRQQTRRSTVIIAGTFAALAMALSTLAVTLIGGPNGDNFPLNATSVVLALVITAALTRYSFWNKPWMDAATYGWQLKRNLMSVTNVMHHVEVGVRLGDAEAMKLLRFYHQGITQMYLLDANTSSLAGMVGEIDQHREAMQAQGLDVEQPRLDPAWLEAVKRRKA